MVPRTSDRTARDDLRSPVPEIPLRACDFGALGSLIASTGAKHAGKRSRLSCDILQLPQFLQVNVKVEIHLDRLIGATPLIVAVDVIL
jgi:hypothetical protein